MKNFKKVFICLTITSLLFGPTTALASNNIGGGGVEGYSNCVPNSSASICFKTTLDDMGGDLSDTRNGTGMQGIRLSVVDENGNRVSGTRSVDIVNDSRYVEGANNDWDSGLLHYSEGAFGSLERNSSDETRNEALDSVNIEHRGRPTIYYWSALPDFINSGDNTTLGLFFDSLHSERPQDVDKIFSLINYTNKSSKDYIIVEPILYLHIHRYHTRDVVGAYYGTATEVYKMCVQDGVRIFREIWQSEYPLAVYTKDRIIGNQVYSETAGLQSIDPSSRSDWSSGLSEDGLGVGAGHIWVNCLTKGSCCDENTRKCSCTPEPPTLSIINDCTTSSEKTGSVSDTEDWECIYQQKGQDQNTYLGQFYHPNGGSVINDYCSVACREDITYNYGGSFRVEAGRVFTIGNQGFQDINNQPVASINPPNFYGKSTCQVDGDKIDVDKFKKDYEEANDNVKDEWDSYQSDAAYNQAVRNVRDMDTDDCDTIETGGGECTKYATKTIPHYRRVWTRIHWEMVVDEDADGNETYELKQKYDFDLPSCEKQKSTDICTYEDRYTGSETVETDECIARTPEYWVKKCSSSVDYNGGTETASYIVSSDGNHGDTSKPEERGNSVDDFNSAVADRDSKLAQIRSCNNFQRTYNEFNPQVSFAYSEHNYKSTYALEQDNVDYTSTSYYYDGNTQVGTHEWNTNGYNTGVFKNDTSSNYGNTSTITKYDCNDELQPCTTSSVTYPTNTGVRQVTEKHIDYKLPDNVYRYLSKNGISYNSAADAMKDGGSYMDLGYSNLPVSFYYNDKTSGKSPIETSHDYYFEFYYDKNGSPNLFGRDQKFYKYNPGEKFNEGNVTTYPVGGKSSIKLNSTTSYHCTYKVYPFSCPAEIYNTPQKMYCCLHPKDSTCEGNNYCLPSRYPTADSMKCCLNPDSDECINFCETDPYKCGKVDECSQYTDSHDKKCCLNPELDECKSDCEKDPTKCEDYKDVKVVYREISLNDPFPALDGSGRTPGSNWNLQLDDGTSFVDKYIKNNRGVSGEEVYNKTPMYEFVLSPSNIRSIRKYNSSVSNNYNDDSLECTDNSYCKSSFLKDGIAKNYFKFTTNNSSGGTCYNAYKDSWETCRK